MTILRPMLASNDVITDYDALTYPLIASPKLDGWRSYNVNGEPRTRSGKPIPNVHTRAILTLPELEGLDGELICGSATDPNSMQKAQSAFSSHGGEPDFKWYIFDDWRRDKISYWDHWRQYILEENFPSFCKLLPQRYISTSAELEQYASELLNAGYEGVITRTPNSPYKNGRSTRRQEWMLKVKPYAYEEGVIKGFRERMTNLNNSVVDDLGYQRRSGHQDNKIGADTLGSFYVSSACYAESFYISCGHLDDIQKKKIWDNPQNYRNQVITFKHFKQTGVVNKPRHGQFVAFRAKEDL